MERCVALMADEAVVYVPFASDPIPRRVEGRAAILPLFMQVGGLFKIFEWTSLAVHGTEDPALAIAFAHAEIELSNGDPYSQDYVLMVRQEHGRICEYTEYNDPIRAAKAFSIGASLAEPPLSH
jgi:ketosteroid isomerase-like protein